MAGTSACTDVSSDECNHLLGLMGIRSSAMQHEQCARACSRNQVRVFTRSLMIQSAVVTKRGACWPPPYEPCRRSSTTERGAGCFDMAKTVKIKVS